MSPLAGYCCVVVFACVCVAMCWLVDVGWIVRLCVCCCVCVGCCVCCCCVRLCLFDVLGADCLRWLAIVVLLCLFVFVLPFVG